jgi:hypothetical protein
VNRADVALDAFAAALARANVDAYVILSFLEAGDDADTRDVEAAIAELGEKAPELVDEYRHEVRRLRRRNARLTRDEREVLHRDLMTELAVSDARLEAYPRRRERRAPLGRRRRPRRTRRVTPARPGDDPDPLGQRGAA